MTTGTVKSFNRSKGYGFIKTVGGADVFVHLSAVRTAGFRDLRKGQKVSFEIFDNQGKAAARNLLMNGPAEDDSGHKFELRRKHAVQHESKKDGTIGKKAYMDCARRA